MKILDGLYGFIWQSASENNCNSFFIDGAKKILIDPGHRHLFQHVKRGLAQIETTPEQIDVVLVTHGHPDHLEMVGSFGPATRWAMSRIDYEFVMKYIGSHMDFPAPAFFLQEGDLDHRRQDLSGDPDARPFAGIDLSVLAGEKSALYGRCGLQPEHRQDGPSGRIGKAVEGEHLEACGARRGGSLPGSRGCRGRAREREEELQDDQGLLVQPAITAKKRLAQAACISSLRAFH